MDDIPGSLLTSLAGDGAQSDSDRGPLLIRTVWTLTAVSIVFVAARFWLKLRKTRRLYWDDALIGAALVSGIMHSIWTTKAVHYGLGRHILRLSLHELGRTLEVGMWSLLPAFVSPMFGRLAFCVTVLYLAGTDPRVTRWPIWVFVVLQVAVNISALIVFYTQCGTHLDALFHPWLLAEIEQYCKNARIQTDFGYFQGSVNTFTDAFLTALPAIMIEHTQISLKGKLGLACLLCLSVLAMIASIVKTYEAKSLSMLFDFSYDLCPYVIWLSIELNVVIIVASIPFLRSLFTQPATPPVEHRRTRSWATSTIDSLVRAGKSPRTTLSRIDSQEDIIPSSAIQMQRMSDMGILVTTEVEVTTIEVDNAPFVHAALVGLRQELVVVITTLMTITYRKLPKDAVPRFW